jgi:hypothetical protein
VSLQTKATKV